MTNWQIVGLIAGLVFSIFGAGWMNMQLLKYYLDAKIDGLRGELLSEVGSLRSEINGLRGEMNARFDTQDQNAKNLSQRVERIEKQFDKMFLLVMPK